MTWKAKHFLDKYEAYLPSLYYKQYNCYLYNKSETAVYAGNTALWESQKH